MSSRVSPEDLPGEPNHQRERLDQLSQTGNFQPAGGKGKEGMKRDRVKEEEWRTRITGEKSNVLYVNR